MTDKTVEAIIDDLLEKVLKKYPKERFQKIIDRTAGIWYNHPQKDRLTYSYCKEIYNIDNIANMPELPAGTGEFERDLIGELQIIDNHSIWDDDYYPALMPGIKQICIPSYFGCELKVASASDKVIPIIKDPSDVYSLPEIGFISGTEGGDILAKMRYFRQRTHGLLPIYITDMQGPFSVASQIWGIEDFLTAIYDYPDEVHYLINKCTEVIIDYFKLMYEAVEGDLNPLHCMPVVWYPPDKGVAVSEDLLAVVSPEIIREFMKPGYERIAEEFGGVFTHSCGSINHAAQELNNIKGLVGINFSSSETDLAKMSNDLKNDLVIISHNAGVNRDDLPLLDITGHIRICKKIFAGGRNIICVIFGGWPDDFGIVNKEVWMNGF
ncbi:MAG: uroporphyrinogen decarboxylase family protein [Saccharofermentanales bacterium]